MTLKKPSMILACLLGLTSLTACNAQEAAKSKDATPAKAGPDAAKPLATVNGVAIPQSRADFLLKRRVEQGQPDTPEMRKSIHDSLVHREVISQEAAKKGLDKNSDVAMQMEMAKQEVLVNAFVQDYLKSHAISDDAVKAEYEKIKAQMGDKEYKARHILVEKEDEAKAIIAQLAKGAKFEKLAEEKSKDPSKSQGGDLGWNGAGAYVKPFADAMIALKKGETTKTPVQSQFGWHVIKLEEVRPMTPPPMDSVLPQLRQRMQQQLIEKAVSELMAQAKMQ
jgi:peptidyl-prolyl cis-trans isomerase C